MPNLQNAVANHWNRLQCSNGIEANLAGVRDGQEKTGNARIVLGRIDSQALTSREVTADADAQDIFVEARDWDDWFNSPPQAGDKFIYSLDGSVGWNGDVTAEVRPVNDTIPCFTRWYGGLVLRVHCKIVERQT